jgi:hypothetical protein
MTTYRFTLEVSGINSDQDGLAERFYGNGVDDALVYVSNGHVFLAFDRDADDERNAVKSAMQDIHQRGGTVIKVVWDTPRSAAE